MTTTPTVSPESRARINWPLAGLGLVSLVGYAAAVGLRAYSDLGDVVRFLLLFGGLFVVYGAALVVMRRWPERPSGVREVMVWAVMFRVALVPVGLDPGDWPRELAADLAGEDVTYERFLLYDNDVWRYLWDGHVGRSGLDPYVWTPAALELLAFEGDPLGEVVVVPPWDAVLDHVGFRDYTTVYPPAAQALFRAVHVVRPASVAAWKLVAIGIDLALCLVMAMVARRLGHRADLAVLVYAWNPLVLKELVASAHVDGLMMLWLALAVLGFAAGRRGLGMAAFGVSVLAKVTPVVLLPLFLRRSRPREWLAFGAVMVLGFLPYRASWGDLLYGLATFSREWVFNPGPWAVAQGLAKRVGLLDGWVPGGAVAHVVWAVGTLAIVGWAVANDDGSERHLIRGIFAGLAAVVVLGPTVMPWYLLWALPFAAIGWDRRSSLRPVSWLVLTGLCLLSYLNYVEPVERVWWRMVEFGGFAVVLAWERRRGRATTEDSTGF